MEKDTREKTGNNANRKKLEQTGRRRKEMYKL